MSTKRKHATLSLQVKNEIIESLSKGVSKKTLAEKYGVGRATIYGIEKNKEKIQKFVSNVDTSSGDRKTLRGAEYKELEEALYTWFLQERRRNTPISGPLITAKAKYLYEKLSGKTDFSASCGWLERFKKRHGIRFLKVKGEKLSCDTTHVEEFKNQFLQKVADSNLSPSQIYNSDESGLLPNKTFVSSNEVEAVGRKISKEQHSELQAWHDGSQERNIAAEFISHEEIVELATAAMDEEEEDDENPPTSNTSISASEAIKSFDVCIKWAEEQGCTFSEILLLKRMQDKAIKQKIIELFKQH